jgi:hypothetical protein
MTRVEQPAVSVVIKATALDAPYLEVMVPHMITEARFPFAERVVVVDRRVEYTGKYRDRPGADPDQLRDVLDRLVAKGSLDRVVEVDESPSVMTDVIARYFPSDVRSVPAYASTGGPIYPTLFGLETVATDHVIQMDCDVFFHAANDSWVRRGLDAMSADRSLWLMMSHPGPPAGPPGRSLAPANARRASWDGARSLWLFRTATTRYFLCDRRRLRGRLRAVRRRSDCAPLEVCITNAMARHSAYRGSTDGSRGWHLHAWSHASPFPELCARIAELVQAGRFPDLQKGNYDLRLDRAPDRAAWAALSVEKPESAVLAVASAVPKPSRRQPHWAPVGVVIPIRNRAPKMLARTLFSLAWQSEGPPAEIHVVSHGSSPDVDEAYEAVCAANGATLIRLGHPEEPWNKSLAVNTGLRAGSAQVPYVMSLDADMILHESFLSVVVDRLRAGPMFLLCMILDLPRTIRLANAPAALQRSFPQLRRMARPRGRHGTGAAQASSREFFHAVRGYDEDLAWWGAMDGDMVDRARAFGLPVKWIDDRTAMLHQWHPRKHAVLTDPAERSAARSAWWQNHNLVRQRNAAGLVQRNPARWGGAP